MLLRRTLLGCVNRVLESRPPFRICRRGEKRTSDSLACRAAARALDAGDDIVVDFVRRRGWAGGERVRVLSAARKTVFSVLCAVDASDRRQR